MNKSAFKLMVILAGLIIFGISIPHMPVNGHIQNGLALVLVVLYGKLFVHLYVGFKIIDIAFKINMKRLDALDFTSLRSFSSERIDSNDYNEFDCFLDMGKWTLKQIHPELHKLYEAEVNGKEIKEDQATGV